MSLQTEFMRATPDRFVTAIEHKDGTFSGVEYVNHPKPSGAERWLPTYSDSRRWPTKRKAVKEFKAVLPKPQFGRSV